MPMLDYIPSSTLLYCGSYPSVVTLDTAALIRKAKPEGDEQLQNKSETKKA